MNTPMDLQISKYKTKTNEYIDKYINKDAMDPLNKYKLDALMKSMDYTRKHKKIYGAIKLLHKTSFRKSMANFDRGFKKIALMAILIGVIMVNGGNTYGSIDRGFMEFMYLCGFLMIALGTATVWSVPN